mgnify:CR=1 FL=1
MDRSGKFFQRMKEQPDSSAEEMLKLPIIELASVVKSMTHVELPCYIRRRHYDGERFPVPVNLRIKSAFCLPHLIDTVLKILRIICLCEILHCFYVTP